MAMTNTAIQLALNYVTLTEPVTRIMNSLPRVLPPELYTRTSNVIGNKYRRVVFRPTRQAARMTPYGSPPRAVRQTGAGIEDIVMIHSSEQIDAGPEVLEMFMEYADVRLQNMAEQEMDRRAKDFAVRSENLRTTAIHQMVANGKIFFDANSDVAATDQVGSGGYTVDYKVPSSNITAAGVDFSNSASDIVNWLVGFQRDYLFATGRSPKYAICGKNIATYLANNTRFKEFLRYNRPVADQYIESGLIPQASNVLGLTWIFAHGAHFERADGQILGLFPDDQITFLPDLTPDMYDLKLGSVPVPKTFLTFQQGGDFNSVIREMLNNPQHGAVRFAYGKALPFPEVTMVQADTFYPDFKNPNTMYIIDTTP